MEKRVKNSKNEKALKGYSSRSTLEKKKIKFLFLEPTEKFFHLPYHFASVAFVLDKNANGFWRVREDEIVRGCENRVIESER